MGGGWGGGGAEAMHGKWDPCGKRKDEDERGRSVPGFNRVGVGYLHVVREW